MMGMMRVGMGMVMVMLTGWNFLGRNNLLLPEPPSSEFIPVYSDVVRGVSGCGGGEGDLVLLYVSHVSPCFLVL